MQKTDAYRGLRDISLSKEKLEALARETAARSVRMDKRALKRSGVFDISGDRRALIALNARLDQLAEIGVELPIGAKSLMDAFYVIEKTAAALEASFDAKRRMPMVPVEAEGERVNLPRIYSIAIDIAGRRSGRVDTAALEAYLNAYQAVRPLTMRELSLLLSTREVGRRHRRVNKIVNQLILHGLPHLSGKRFVCVLIHQKQNLADPAELLYGTA